MHGGARRSEQLGKLLDSADPSDLYLFIEAREVFDPRKLLSPGNEDNSYQLAWSGSGPGNHLAAVWPRELANNRPNKQVPAVIGCWEQRDSRAALRAMVIDYQPWTIIAVHLPATRGPLSFVPWEAFWTQQAELARRPTIIIGDWNSGAALDRQSKKRFTVEKHFTALSAEYQWTDLWRLVHGRSQEYTWFSHAGNGFRVDHCFISPAGRELITTADCYYDHRFRESGASDHSALRVELEWEG